MRTKNTLSHAEFYRLCEWTKTADFTGVHTLNDAASFASRCLSIIVPASTMGNAIEATGKVLPPRLTSEAGKKRDRVAVLANELIALMQSLDREPSEQLLSISRTPN